MKLKSLSVENFRCYKTRTTITFDDMTTIVGRNDAGKSSLLDALDIFFNDRFPDKNDAAKGGNAKAVLISCIFTELPTQLILDETALTSLSDERLLNAAGDLEVTKMFNCSLEKPKLIALRARAMHPGAADARDLLALKIDELKTRAQNVGVDMEAVNKTVKRDLRQAIRARVGNLQLVETDVTLLGDGIDEREIFRKYGKG